MADVVKLNGTMSAEHGVGFLKKEILALEVGVEIRAGA
jgi:FAD/FMN-containing dehydrogenase